MEDLTEEEQLALEKSAQAPTAELAELVLAADIQTDDDFRFVTAVEEELRRRVKLIEAEFKERKETAHAAHKAVCEAEKAALSRAPEAIKQFKAKRIAYEQAVNARRLAAAREAGVMPVVNEEIHVKGARTEWKWRVVDPALVPDQYKVIDDKAVTQVVKGLKERTQIPGIKVFSVTV